MNYQTNTQLAVKPPGECISQSQAMQFLALGDLMGWHPQLIGKAPMLNKPVRLENWMLVPAHEDTSDIPKRTIKRIQTIYTQGLRPQGFVVVHEAPMQLRAPEQTHSSRVETLKPGIDISKGIETLLKVAGMAMMAVFLLPIGFLTVLDPIMVAVTEDNYWIEIDRWVA